ncbi:MAG: SNF2-related protein [Myxococcota bacterium]
MSTAYLQLASVASAARYNPGWPESLALPFSGLVSAVPEALRSVDFLRRLHSTGQCKTVHDLVTKPLVIDEIRRRFGASGEQQLATYVASWLDRHAVPAAVTKRGPGRPSLQVQATREAPAPLPPPVVELGVSMTTKQWTAWVGQSIWRRIAADTTLAELKGTAELRGYLPPGSSIENLLCHYAGMSYYRVHPELITAGLALCRMAEQPEAAAREEVAARLSAPPLSDAELEAMRQQVLGLRTQVAGFGVPRPKDLTRIDVHLLGGGERRVVFVDHDARRFCAKHRSDGAVFVDFTVDGATLPDLASECSPSCQVTVAALDRLLDLLHAEPVPANLRQFAHILAVPIWQLAIDKLDALLAAQPDPNKPLRHEQLAWQIAGATARPEVSPLWLGKDRKGQPKLKKASLKELRLTPALCTTPADAKVAELLRPDPGLTTAMANLPDAERNLCRVMRALVGHPHLFHADGEPTAVREVPFRLRLEARGTGARWRVDLPPGLHVPMAVLQWLPGPKADCLIHLAGDHWQVTPMTLPQIALLRTLAQDDEVPAGALESWLQRLPRLAQLAPAEVPEKLRGQRVPASVRPVLQVDALPGAELSVTPRVRPLPGGALQRPGMEPVDLYGQHDGQRVWTRRDLAGEKAALEACWTLLGVETSDDSGETLHLQGDEALEAVSRLAAHPDAVEVHWARRRKVVTAKTEDLRVQVLDRPDWFGVQGKVQVGDATVDLAPVLDAIRNRRAYVQVTGDLWLKLSDALRVKLEAAADAVVATKDGLALSPLHAQVLDGVAEGVAQGRWVGAVQRIRNAGDLRPKVPVGLLAELRPYQREGFEWLARLAEWSTGAVLADDMGLGKTVQALALLLHRQELGPALVVAPTSVEFNWLREAQTFAPGLRLQAWRHGDRKQAASLRGGDVLVISYDLLVRDAAVLAAVHWATLVCDEAQAVKNATTRRWKAVTALKADFRLGLTGTPVENHIGELWAVLAAVVPGLMGPWPLFQERFGIAIERDGNVKSQQALGRILKPFVLRRLKSAVAKDLPPRTEIRVDIEPSDDERLLYEQVRLASLQEINDAKGPPQQKRFQVLAAITRLRQVACHARLFDPTSPIPSSKLEHLLERLAELREEGHRALVFSQFVTHLALVRERLDAAEVPYRYLDGSTPEKDRRKEVDAFQRGQGSVFLISLKAGGTGLNLTAADYVVHLDPWWNPAVEDQATDRAHRIGQDKPVTVYRLVARGTIEERILELHARKRDLVSALLDGTADAGRLTTEELVGLLAEAAGRGSPGGKGDRSPRPVTDPSKRD